ncbi:hypothetical protein DEI89_12665 [Curtobacterium sp. MCBD17_030]|nr:hypothetical protein DEI89_12665 [Curtobacterium sp. MCBD17_030]
MTSDESLGGQLNREVAPSGTGCVECTIDGSWWVHLRRCAACGHVGCCDDSMNRHARSHASHTGHRFIQSFEPGEDWIWDFATRSIVSNGPALAPPTAHPSSQPAPGPEGSVPPNWMDQLNDRNQREAQQ